MGLKNKKHLFNIFGSSIVILWLVLIGVLIKDVNSRGGSDQPGAIEGKVSTIASPQRDWMEIYLKGQKVGYSMTQINPVGENYLIREEILLNLNLMGQPTSMYMVTRSVVDQRFLLRKFKFSMKSGVVSYKISGTVDGNFMQLEIGEGKAKRTERLSLSDPPMIGAGLAPFFKGRPIEVGQSFKFPIFDPSTMTLKDLVVKVAERETLVIRRIEYSTFRLEAQMLGQPMTFWVDESGTVLKEKSIVGLTLIKSSAAMAPRDIEGGGGSDFYELAAIHVKGRLREPAKLTYLSLKVEGIAEEHFDTAILDKGRQRFRSGMIEVVQEEIPIKAGYTLPFEDRSGKMNLFLKPEFNIESDHEAITGKARDIAGNIRAPSSVARKIMTWVYKNVEKRPVISVPSALEVLKNMVGDCNEHAALLTGLLRALGIPARVCVGIVYARGRFYYHAWTEGFLGRWISMDAALNQMPTDATHIKLVEGGLDRQVDIIALIGKLKLEVVDYRYD
jgi:hypothetical protein